MYFVGLGVPVRIDALRPLAQASSPGNGPWRHGRPARAACAALPVTGFPEAAALVPRPGARLTDACLEDVARRYLVLGRGYAREIARDYGVSARTVVSWVEKARERGILTRTRPGQWGGEMRSPRRSASG